jgi:ribonuclease III family protein
LLNQEPIADNLLGQYSPLVLAYIGDAVYELMVRTNVVAAGPRRIKEIHLDTVEMVKAEHQAHLIRLLTNELTEAEQAIVKRGRNTRSNPPKNAEMYQYRLSTGFEALMGYLYLKGDMERLEYIFKRSMEKDKAD